MTEADEEYGLMINDYLLEQRLLDEGDSDNE
jgi:hypothetical protein